MHTTLKGMAAVIGIACSNSPAQANGAAPREPLQVFSFFGQDTARATTMTELKGTPCKQKGDELKCEGFSIELGGVKLKFLSMSYYRGRLYRVYGALPNAGMGDILSAFSAKYGNPMPQMHTWQNRAGAKFDNPSFLWTFTCGTLTLETLGWDINSSSFEFSCPVNQPPPEKPVVDF